MKKKLLIYLSLGVAVSVSAQTARYRIVKQNKMGRNEHVENAAMNSTHQGVSKSLLSEWINAPISRRSLLGSALLLTFAQSSIGRVEN